MAFDLSFLISGSTHIEMLTVYASDVTPPSNHICRPGTRKFERFFYVTRGKIVFTLPKGNIIEADAGTIVYLPYDCIYESYWAENESGGYITINFIQHDQTGNIICFGDDICLLIRDKGARFLRCFADILQFWQSDSFNAPLKCYSQFWEILYDISVHLERRSIRSASQVIYPGVLHLENNYLSDFTVEDLAQMCAVSVCTFRRLFHQLKGVSPITYRNRLRMEKAKMLLQSGEYSVTDVSRIVQCANIYYFSRMFKQHFGIAPSECCPK